MKVNLFIAFVVGVLLSACADQNNNNTSVIDINGVWVDSNSSAIQNAVLILSEQNGEVTMSHYLEWKGQKFLEHGVGKRKGSSVIYDTKVTMTINGWATAGTHNLTLSEDGQTLRGTYSDNMNKTGPIVFKRVR